MSGCRPRSSWLEQPLETRVPSLGHARGDLHARLLARIEVDVEVLGLQDLEVEGSILNLVVPEVLRGGGRASPAENADDQRRYKSPGAFALSPHRIPPGAAFEQDTHHE